MLENGFVKLHRSLLKWEWYDDLNTFKLFMHLLLTVNYYDRQWRGKTVKRGSRITSYAILAKETKLSVKSDCNQTLDFDRRGGKGIKF